MNILKDRSKDKDRKLVFLSYLILFLFLLVLHHWTAPLQQDDAWFRERLSDSSLWQFLVTRYWEWSSRVFIEGMLVLLTNTNFWIWKLCNAAFVILGIYSLTELCGLEKKWESIAILGGAFAFFPIETLHSAGWVATTLNYLWPCCAGLYGMLPLARYTRALQGEAISIRSWEYITFTLALLLAANQEQSAALLLGFTVLLFLAYLYKKKQVGTVKIPVYMWVILAILVLSVFCILTCPGNRVRNGEEVGIFFPTFYELSLVEKACMGYLSTMSYFVSGCEKQIILLLPVLVMVFVFWDRKQTADVVVSVLTVCGLLLLGSPVRTAELGNIWGKYQIYYELFSNEYLSRDIFCRYESFWVTVEGILFGLLILWICFLLYRLYGKTEKTLIHIILLGATLLSRVIIGFSSTIYASGYRTAIFITCYLLALTAMLYAEVKGHRQKVVCTICLIALFAWMRF